MITQIKIQKFTVLSPTHNHFWITAREEKIAVKSMTTTHIQNCIKCWLGVGNMEIPHDYLGGKEKWLKIFTQELISRN